jgi:hypothetical protein
MAPVGLVLSFQLKQLLYTALADGSTYSALVPWVLDSEHKVGRDPSQPCVDPEWDTAVLQLSWQLLLTMS